MEQAVIAKSRLTGWFGWRNGDSMVTNLVASGNDRRNSRSESP